MKNTRLKARIIEKYGTQMQLAHILCISEDRLSKIICGRITPRTDEVEAIALCLDVEKNTLFSATAQRGQHNG